MGSVEASVTTRLAELARRAQVRGMCVYTRFLDPAQQSEAAIASAKCGVRLSLEGGHDGAERCMAAFHPESETADFSGRVACVRVDWARQSRSPEHSDLLGASLAIIQDRSFLGDVVIGAGCAYIFVARELSWHLAESLVSVGRIGVKCCQHTGGVEADERAERYIRDTIASFRLDAAVSSAFNLSRGGAQEAISSGRVKLNHIPEIRPDARIKEGDLISVRGMGRALLFQSMGTNRKGRFGVLWRRTPHR